MRLFRNPEVKLTLCVGLPLAAVAWLMLGVLTDWKQKSVLIVAGVTFVLLLALFFFAMGLHYRKVIRFREKVENNTRGQKDLKFDDFTEGEFSSLQHKIMQMVKAHFRQQEEVQTEKERLSEALHLITHQIKTPLYVIELTAKRMMDEPMEPLEQQLNAQRILVRKEQIWRLVTMLLNIAQIDAGVIHFKKEEISVTSLIDEVFDSLDILREVNEITFEKQIPDDLFIHRDFSWLKEALLNIVQNCIEHTPPGGKVSVHVKDGPTYTEIVIRDTGIGISEKDRPHIFEMFYKGEEAHSNSVGIGLALAKKVVEAPDDGSALKVGSNPDGGAEFTMLLRKGNV